MINIVGNFIVDFWKLKYKAPKPNNLREFNVFWLEKRKKGTTRKEAMS